MKSIMNILCVLIVTLSYLHSHKNIVITVNGHEHTFDDATPELVLNADQERLDDMNNKLSIV